jgi:hypothetical protein
LQHRTTSQRANSSQRATEAFRIQMAATDFSPPVGQVRSRAGGRASGVVRRPPPLPALDGLPARPAPRGEGALSSRAATQFTLFYGPAVRRNNHFTLILTTFYHAIVYPSCSSAAPRGEGAQRHSRQNSREQDLVHLGNAARRPRGGGALFGSREGGQGPFRQRARGAAGVGTPESVPSSRARPARRGCGSSSSRPQTCGASAITI